MRAALLLAVTIGICSSDEEKKDEEEAPAAGTTAAAPAEAEPAAEAKAPDPPAKPEKPKKPENPGLKSALKHGIDRTRQRVRRRSVRRHPRGGDDHRHGVQAL